MTVCFGGIKALDFRVSETRTPLIFIQGGSMYKKVDTSLNFVEREKEVIKFWKDNKIFEESVD